MVQHSSETRVIKLKETHPDELARGSDAMTVFRIWSLLGGATQMRDSTVVNRIIG